jgi:outer membrane scaffolding protein for murein synthesis (MipA/OmpV family)
MDQKLREAHFNAALAELHLGRAAAAAKILKPLALKHQNYYAAQFALGCTRICGDKIQEGLKTFSSLETTPLWPTIAYSFEEMARRLSSAGQAAYAEKIRRTASQLQLSVSPAVQAMASDASCASSG